MKHFLKEITLDTRSPVEFVDLTKEVAGALEESRVKDGIVTIFTKHTTTAIKINERCERLQDDMKEMLINAVRLPHYRHDENTVDSRANSKSHLMSMLLSASENIPVSGGRLMLGGWQSVFFVELDGPRRQRQIMVKIIGE